MAKSKKQRIKDNNKKRVIVDIIDWSTSFRSQWYSRKKIYSAMDTIGVEFDIILEKLYYIDFT